MISVCMFIVSNVLIISSATVIVRAVVVCLPRPMEGMGWLQFSDLFTECQFHHRRMESSEHLMYFFIYNSEHYGLIFGPYRCHIIFTMSSLFIFLVCTLPFFRKDTLHVC